jgi:hypothetical protein
LIDIKIVILSEAKDLLLYPHKIVILSEARSAESKDLRFANQPACYTLFSVPRKQAAKLP